VPWIFVVILKCGGLAWIRIKDAASEGAQAVHDTVGTVKRKVNEATIDAGLSSTDERLQGVS
jgi:hypothetical protein